MNAITFYARNVVPAALLFGGCAPAVYGLLPVEYFI